MSKFADLPWERETEAKGSTMSEEEIVEEGTEEVNPEDLFGAPEPEEADPAEGAEEPTAEEPTEEPEGEPAGAEETPEAEAEPETPAEPELVAYEIDGAEIMVTPEQLKRLEARDTTALQLPSLQQTLEREREAWKMAQAAAAGQVKQPAAEEAAFDPAAFTTRMKPVTDAAVARGAISEDFAELYPVEAASLVWAGQLANDITETLNGLTTGNAESAAVTERGEYTAQVFRDMQKLAEDSPDVFGELTDPKTKESYLGFLIEVDIGKASLEGDRAQATLAKMYGAFRGEEMRAAAQVVADKARIDQETARRNAGGAGGGGGSRSKPDDNLADINAILGS